MPVPEAPRPIVVLSFVQLYCVAVPVKLMESNVPEQVSIEGNASTIGTGLTVSVNVMSGPIQPFNVGVTVINEITGCVVPFVVVNEGIDPEPDAPKPVCVLSLVHVNEVPGELVKSIDKV